MLIKKSTDTKSQFELNCVTRTDYFTILNLGSNLGSIKAGSFDRRAVLMECFPNFKHRFERCQMLRVSSFYVKDHIMSKKFNQFDSCVNIIKDF